MGNDDLVGITAECLTDKLDAVLLIADAIDRRAKVERTLIVSRLALGIEFNVQAPEILKGTHILAIITLKILISRPKAVDIKLDPFLFDPAKDLTPKPPISQRKRFLLPVRRRLFKQKDVIGLRQAHAKEGQHNCKCENCYNGMVM